MLELLAGTPLFEIATALLSRDCQTWHKPWNHIRHRFGETVTTVTGLEAMYFKREQCGTITFHVQQKALQTCHEALISRPNFWARSTESPAWPAQTLHSFRRAIFEPLGETSGKPGRCRWTRHFFVLLRCGNMADQFGAGTACGLWSYSLANLPTLLPCLLSTRFPT